MAVHGDVRAALIDYSLLGSAEGGEAYVGLPGFMNAVRRERHP
jgi:hypothetical protein